MSPTGPYDQDLLASAPAATKAQLQEGYTTDLLDPSHGNPASPHPAQSEQSPLAPQADSERGSVSPAKELNGYGSSAKTVPFWRTTKGIIIIIVAIVIVLGAVIGGAVGGTRKKDKGTPVGAAPATSTSTSTSTSTTAPANSGGDLSAGATPTGQGAGVGTQPASTTSRALGIQVGR